jgi:hypothetical protein
MGKHSFWKDTWWPENHMGRRLVSPFIHMLSAHYPYEEWCSKHHPSLDKFKCAIEYGQLKDNQDYDVIPHVEPYTHFGYYDPDQTIKP